MVAVDAVAEEDETTMLAVDTVVDINHSMDVAMAVPTTEADIPVLCIRVMLIIMIIKIIWNKRQPKMLSRIMSNT